MGTTQIYGYETRNKKEEQIYSVERPNLTFYRRYIDDIMMIWKGTEDSLKYVFDEINQNRYGISFTGDWNQYSIDYYKANGKLGTRTFFKQTDCNGYIPTKSCHHPIRTDYEDLKKLQQ